VNYLFAAILAFVILWSVLMFNAGRLEAETQCSLNNIIKTLGRIDEIIEEINNKQGGV
jgi:hypothetical protein